MLDERVKSRTYCRWCSKLDPCKWCDAASDIDQSLSQILPAFLHRTPRRTLACCWSHEWFLSRRTNDRSAHWWCLEACRRNRWSSIQVDWENRWPNSHVVRSVVSIRVRSSSLDHRLFWMSAMSTSQRRSKDPLCPHLAHRNNVDPNTSPWLREDPWPYRFSDTLFFVPYHKRVPWSYDEDVGESLRPDILHNNHIGNTPCSYTDIHREECFEGMHRNSNSFLSFSHPCDLRSWKEDEKSCTSFNIVETCRKANEDEQLTWLSSFQILFESMLDNLPDKSQQEKFDITRCNSARRMNCTTHPSARGIWVDESFLFRYDSARHQDLLLFDVAHVEKPSEERCSTNCEHEAISYAYQRWCEAVDRKEDVRSLHHSFISFNRETKAVGNVFWLHRRSSLSCCISNDIMGIVEGYLRDNLERNQKFLTHITYNEYHIHAAHWTYVVLIHDPHQNDHSPISHDSRSFNRVNLSLFQFSSDLTWDTCAATHWQSVLSMNTNTSVFPLAFSSQHRVKRIFFHGNEWDGGTQQVLWQHQNSTFDIWHWKISRIRHLIYVFRS